MSTIPFDKIPTLTPFDALTTHLNNTEHPASENESFDRHLRKTDRLSQEVRPVSDESHAAGKEQTSNVNDGLKNEKDKPVENGRDVKPGNSEEAEPLEQIDESAEEEILGLENRPDRLVDLELSNIEEQPPVAIIQPIAKEEVAVPIVEDDQSGEVQETEPVVLLELENELVDEQEENQPESYEENDTLKETEQVPLQNPIPVLEKKIEPGEVALEQSESRDVLAEEELGEAPLKKGAAGQALENSQQRASLPQDSGESRERSKEPQTSNTPDNLDLFKENQDSQVRSLEVGAELETSSDTSSEKEANGDQKGQSTNTPSLQEAGESSKSRLSQHIIARNGQKPASGIQITEADKNRFMQRVARAFQSAQDGDGKLQLRLSPPELGVLRLEIKVENGVMFAKLEAETTSARSILIDNISTLRARLAEQGIRVEQFDIDLMDRQANEQPDTAGNHSDRDPPSRNEREATRSEEAKQKTLDQHSSPLQFEEGGGLNVIA